MSGQDAVARLRRRQMLETSDGVRSLAALGSATLATGFLKSCEHDAATFVNFSVTDLDGEREGVSLFPYSIQLGRVLGGAGLPLCR